MVGYFVAKLCTAAVLDSNMPGMVVVSDFIVVAGPEMTHFKVIRV